ncbi:hypothetical protein WN50_35770 [Limnoraphis robusta CS-951]|uniref:Uncharacterized protein n=1 Tax=Limnoraphis robusta CS-951 TaxID=1637645 RepID=A0A0F5YB26_9CYAN|nr:hypothetical protein WN50_25305 [Limnoraphis robusta CS-951]KMW70316.1 hypothetical protein WN50_36265 [Limnoraphis robusta CS-951]KMW70377.1 hypothetical protein WN50_35770 [Limnoraphis robusta CS-951]
MYMKAIKTLHCELNEVQYRLKNPVSSTVRGKLAMCIVQETGFLAWYLQTKKPGFFYRARKIGDVYCSRNRVFGVLYIIYNL